MPALKLNVGFSFFPYGGNGGISSEHPSIRAWFAATIAKCKSDSRIGDIVTKDYADTPITMMRNRAVLDARKAGCDVLVMVDSDQHPDLYLGIINRAVPFFDSSCDFLYERKRRGLVTTIGAPYCGPPPQECVYVFRWTSKESQNPNIDCSLAMYSREEACAMTGIQPAAALPTGLIMFDMEVFNVTDPVHEFNALRKKYPLNAATALTRPWFYYEYEDIYAAVKASTEDVTASRDMNLVAAAKLGYSPCYANWEAWAGHWKPKCVGMPILLTSEMINSKYAEAVLSGREQGKYMMDITTMNAAKSPVALVQPAKTVYNGAVNDTIALATVEATA